MSCSINSRNHPAVGVSTFIEHDKYGIVYNISNKLYAINHPWISIYPFPLYGNHQNMDSHGAEVTQKQHPRVPDSQTQHQ